MKHLKQLAAGLDVAPVLAELAANEDLWNAYTLRTSGAAPAHNQVSDIWVRYRDIQELGDMGSTADVARFVGEEHESVWYPAIDKLPSLRSLIFEVCRYWEVERLGGVLITRIPPGGEVKPHIDRGWHANYYRDKIAITLASNSQQTFCYADGEFRCETGTVFAFCNQAEHWVKNDSREQRMTCIIAARTDMRRSPLWQSVGEQ